jgi:hypothetical protein
VRKRNIIVAGVAGLALAGGSLAVGATAFAATPAPTVLKACVSKDGTMKSVGAHVKSCSQGRKLLTWSIKGEKGATGAKGADGLAGGAGTDGLPGGAGTDGLPGAAGADGLPGAAGADGATGPMGPMGPMGMGMPGPMGPMGPGGAKGDPGAKGDQGLQGLQGGQGLQGDPGAKGDQGIQGGQGLQGDPGASGTAGKSVALTQVPGTLVAAVGVTSFTVTCPADALAIGGGYTKAAGDTAQLVGSQQHATNKFQWVFTFDADLMGNADASVTCAA